MSEVTTRTISTAILQPVNQTPQPTRTKATLITTPSSLMMCIDLIPGTDGETGSREAIGPGQTLVLSLSAEHSLLVFLCVDVLLPLPITVTVFPTQRTVETVQL